MSTKPFACTEDEEQNSVPRPSMSSRLRGSRSSVRLLDHGGPQAVEGGESGERSVSTEADTAHMAPSTLEHMGAESVCLRVPQLLSREHEDHHATEHAE